MAWLSPLSFEQKRRRNWKIRIFFPENFNQIVGNSATTPLQIPRLII
jgi:hypothetical protein